MESSVNLYKNEKKIRSYTKTNLSMSFLFDEPQKFNFESKVKQTFSRCNTWRSSQLDSN